MKRLFPPLLALHRYFMAANKMRIDFENALLRFDISRYNSNPLLGVIALHADEPGIYMSYWYSGLYVLIEGWRELGFKDPAIDTLIASPNVDLLRRFRNGTFHFQPDYFTEKQTDFVKAQDSVAWVREMTEAFSQYFLREIPAAKASHESTKTA